MPLLSDEEASTWCHDRGVLTDGPQLSVRLGFPSNTAKRIRIRLPDDCIATVGLGYVLLLSEIPNYEEKNFRGGLVWLRRWAIWSESIDRVGYALLDGIRATSGHISELDSAPAQLFKDGELVHAHAALSLPMLFQWDAHYVPATGEFIVFVSHEGHADIISGDERVHATMLQRLHDWSPVEE